jgi:hypothetical protein
VEDEKENFMNFKICFDTSLKQETKQQNKVPETHVHHLKVRSLRAFEYDTNSAVGA